MIEDAMKAILERDYPMSGAIKVVNFKKIFAIPKYIAYLCIVNRYNEQRNIIMYNTNSALTEAVYYILLALQQPLHGYGIMQQTSALSKGRLSLSAGTLYGALSNLLEKKWIIPYGDSYGQEGRRKQYLITDAGKKVLDAEFERLEEMVENGKKYILR